MDAKTLCLGALAHGPATGYDIRKMFEEGAYSCFHPIGFGSIYPALTALHAGGLVECQAEEQAGRPDRKVYSLTARGRAALEEALSGTPQPDKYKSDALFMLSLSELMEPAQVRHLLDTYRGFHAGELDKMSECDDADMSAGARFVFGLGKAVYSAIATYIEENSETLVEALEKGDSKTAPGFGCDDPAWREAGE